MYRSGRSIAQDNAYLALLCDHHSIEVTMTLLDLDMNEVPGGEISARLEDGQVTFDADADITRGLDLDLLDPTGALHLDSNSPDAGAMFADRMIRVKHHVINPLRTVRYTTPLFTGPITSLERNGIEVKAECQGKEIFGLSPTWNEKTFKKGSNLVGVIRVLLRDYMGETHYNLPSSGAITRKTLPRNVSVGGDDKLPWKVAKDLAASEGYQLYFDGMGVCQMRPVPRGSVFTFRTGPGGSVKSDPDIGFDITKVINAVEVFGKKPTKKKGKPQKARPHYRIVAPRSHPLSPWALGRTGRPRYLPRIIEDDGVTTNAEAKKYAQRELARGLLESVDVAYTTVTIPSIEELDIVTIKTSKFTAQHRARKFAVGLRSSASASMGYVANVKPNVSGIRTKSNKQRSR